MKYNAIFSYIQTEANTVFFCASKFNNLIHSPYGKVNLSYGFLYK